MSSVWYIGNATQRLISSKMWKSAIGSGSYSDSSWDASNGWSLPQASFSGAQLAFLTSDVEFSLNQPDGPRTSVIPSAVANRDSALAYYLAAKTAISQLPASSPKLRVVADGSRGYGLTSTATAGTARNCFTMGMAVSAITAEWGHSYVSGSPIIDTDPAGPISFNASLEIISTSNPNLNAGDIYRLTFGGRTSATLDPGGNIIADPLALFLYAGDKIAIRTFLASGTAYYLRQTLPAATNGGGFTATTDLTAPGSAAVSTSGANNVYGPMSILGQSVSLAPSTLGVGDSIMNGSGDGGWSPFGSIATAQEWYMGGGFAARALYGKGGFLNIGTSADEAQWLVAGGARRLMGARRCTSAILEPGINDFFIGNVTAVAHQTNLLLLGNTVRNQGISKVFVTTITPQTTSTDGWATVANQTVRSQESVRVAHNTWVRAGCPIDPTTFAPVAAGTFGALLMGSFGHPITGFFDTASKVESALNSGKWLPCQRVCTGSAVTTSPSFITSTDANFVNTARSAGGDLGAAVILMGAGAAGAVAVGWVSAVTSTTQVTVTSNATVIQTNVTNTQLNVGVMTKDGLHGSTEGHARMSTAIDVAQLV